MLTIQFIPYATIEGLSTDEKVKKIISMVKEEKIIVMEGRLGKKEEAELIKATMEQINEKFKGVEISVVYPEDNSTTLGQKLKTGLAGMLLGERQGLTVIGPASLVKEIKKDPKRIQLLMDERKKRRK